MTCSRPAAGNLLCCWEYHCICLARKLHAAALGMLMQSVLHAYEELLPLLDAVPCLMGSCQTRHRRLHCWLVGIRPFQKNAQATSIYQPLPLLSWLAVACCSGQIPHLPASLPQLYYAQLDHSALDDLLVHIICLRTKPAASEPCGHTPTALQREQRSTLTSRISISRQR